MSAPYPQHTRRGALPRPSATPFSPFDRKPIIIPSRPALSPDPSLALQLPLSVTAPTPFAGRPPHRPGPPAVACSAPSPAGQSRVVWSSPRGAEVPDSPPSLPRNSPRTPRHRAIRPVRSARRSRPTATGTRARPDAFKPAGGQAEPTGGEDEDDDKGADSIEMSAAKEQIQTLSTELQYLRSLPMVSNEILMAEIKAEKQRLLLDNTEMAHGLGLMGKNFAQQSAELGALKKELDHLESECSEQVTSIRRYDEKVRSLTEDNAALSTGQQQAKEQLQTARAALEVAEESQVALRARVKRIMAAKEEAIEDFKEQERANAKLEHAGKLLRAELQNFGIKQAGSEEALEAAQARQDAYVEMFEGYKLEVISKDHFEKTTKRLHGQNTGLRIQIKDDKAEREKTKAEAAQERKQKNQSIAQHEKTIIRLEAEGEDYKEEIAKLKKTVAEGTRAHTKTQWLLGQSKDQGVVHAKHITALRASGAELQMNLNTARDAVPPLAASLVEVTASRDQLQQALDKEQEALAQTQQRLAIESEHYSSLQASNGKLAAHTNWLTVEHKDCAATIKGLQNELQGFEKTLGKKLSRALELLSLERRENEQNARRAARWERKAESMELKIKEAYGKISAVHKQWRTGLATLSEEKREKKLLLERLAKEESFKVEAAAATRRSGKLLVKNGKLALELGTIQKEMKLREHSISVVRQQLIDKSAAHDALVKEHNKCPGRYTDAMSVAKLERSEKEKVQVVKVSLERQLADQSSKLRAAMVKQRELAAALQAAVLVKEQAVAEATAGKAQMEGLQDQLDHLQQRLTANDALAKDEERNLTDTIVVLTNREVDAEAMAAKLSLVQQRLHELQSVAPT